MYFKTVQLLTEEEMKQLIFDDAEQDIETLSGFDRYRAVNVELRNAIQRLISSAKAAILKYPEVSSLLSKNLLKAQGALARAKELELSEE